MFYQKEYYYIDKLYYGMNKIHIEIEECNRFIIKNL
jgi:hypothetical protein